MNLGAFSKGRELVRQDGACHRDALWLEEVVDHFERMQANMDNHDGHGITNPWETIGQPTLFPLA